RCVYETDKDVTINLNWNTNVMQSKVTGTALPVAGAGSLISTQVSNLQAVTLAFATGTCGSETWGGVSADAFKNANIPVLNNAGVNYIVSTGGASGTFTCGSATGLANFIARYYTPHMIGLDFDIEGGQTQAQTDALVAAAKVVESQYPGIRFSFTLATLAASDGSYGGVNALGNQVIQAVLASGLQHYTINLMVMDFGRAQASNCVLKSGGLCDMGASTIKAVENLRHTYGIAPQHIEVTPMLGRNDTADEIFTLADVDTVALYAAQNGLAGVHHWSLDRDTPCATPSDYASPICNSYTGPGVLAYTKRFLTDLGF
ncbi:carbohydrate-binding protein, partial [Pseudoxanthomonas winnipegensis]